MAKKSRRRLRFNRIMSKNRRSKNRRSKNRKYYNKSRKRTHNNKHPYIRSNRIITKISKVMKHPGEYITKDTIPFYLNRKKLDPLSAAQLGTIAAHIGLDISET